MLSWAHRRQLTFILVFLLIVLSIGATVFFVYRPRPTCFDGKQNQDEVGPDCGGLCSKTCTSQLVVPTPTIWWKRVFPSGTPGKYDAAALVENQNSRFGTDKITYAFRLYDKNNVLLAERLSETFFNPQEKFVIYEPNIDTGARVPAEAVLYFDNRAEWQKVTFVPPTLSLASVSYEAIPKPRLSARAKNESLKVLRSTKFVAILSDKDGNALAASQTIIDTFLAGETKDLNFTWPEPFITEPAIKDIFPKQNTFGGTSP
ncbi:MAG: hypothetical protein NTY66_02380 [Candidatus Vogelbacteria bacterium]|nr:hypothetical protein [Candidatus Vogelbacteria bacterium]